MIRLALILLFSSTIRSQDHTQHLIFVTGSRPSKTYDFYETDFELTLAQKFLSIEKNGKNLSEIYLGEDGEFLYWSYKNSNEVERFKFSTGETEKKTFSEGDSIVFIGLGSGSQVYTFAPKTKTLYVHDFASGEKVSEVDALKTVETDMHCSDIDPRKRNEIFFAQCQEKSYFGRVLDVSRKQVVQQYKQELPDCFDGWRITLDAKEAYAFKGNDIFYSPSEGASFEKLYSVGQKIVAFAAGNRELFYSTERKIFKLTKNEKGKIVRSRLLANGNVISIAAFQRPTTSESCSECEEKK